MENKLAFNKKNFDYLLYECLRLSTQRTKDLEEISKKTDKIIKLQKELIYIESGGEIELREKVQVLQRKVSHYQDQYLEAIGEPKVLDNLSAKVLKVVF